jgi:hypothetical protein
MGKEEPIMSTGPRTRFRTCFISAPAAAPTALLRRALEERGIQWSDAATATPVGSSILDTLTAAISGSDFTCAVMTKDRSVGSVLFELGVATGTRRPVLVFVEPGVEYPKFLQSLAYAQIKLEEREALNLHLDAFLKHADLHPPLRSFPDQSEPQRVDIEWALRALNGLEPDSGIKSAADLEWVVARLFEQAGALVATNPSDVVRGVDMVVSIDALEPALGNPLLVEIKAGKMDRKRLKEAERRLRTFVARTPASAGLLVLADDQLHPAEAHNEWPLVVRLGARDLARLVENGTLVKTLVAARNRAAHLQN